MCLTHLVGALVRRRLGQLLESRHARRLRRPDPLGPGGAGRHRRRSAIAGRPATPSDGRHPDRRAAAHGRSPAPPRSRWLHIQRPLPRCGRPRDQADRCTCLCHWQASRGGARPSPQGSPTRCPSPARHPRKNSDALVTEVDRIASIPHVLRRETVVSLSDVKIDAMDPA